MAQMQQTQTQYAEGYVTKRICIDKVIYNPGDGILLEYNHFKKLHALGAVSQDYHAPFPGRPGETESALDEPILPPKPPDTRAQKPTPRGKTRKIKDALRNDPEHSSDRIETHDLQARLEQLQRS